MISKLLAFYFHLTKQNSLILLQIPQRKKSSLSRRMAFKAKLNLQRCKNKSCFHRKMCWIYLSRYLKVMGTLRFDSTIGTWHLQQELLKLQTFTQQICIAIEITYFWASRTEKFPPFLCILIKYTTSAATANTEYVFFCQFHVEMILYGEFKRNFFLPHTLYAFFMLSGIFFLILFIWYFFSRQVNIQHKCVLSIQNKPEKKLY